MLLSTGREETWASYRVYATELDKEHPALQDGDMVFGGRPGAFYSHRLAMTANEYHDLLYKFYCDLVMYTYNVL